MQLVYMVKLIDGLVEKILEMILTIFWRDECKWQRHVIQQATIQTSGLRS